MVFVLVVIVHVLIALFLIAVILLQGGRGGLGEALGGAAAQSLFGGNTNTVMTKITAVSAGLFIITCLSLAALSTAHGRSVMERLPATLPGALPGTTTGVPEALTGQAPAASQDAEPPVETTPAPSDKPNTSQ